MTNIDVKTESYNGHTITMTIRKYTGVNIVHISGGASSTDPTHSVDMQIDGGAAVTINGITSYNLVATAASQEQAAKDNIDATNDSALDAAIAAAGYLMQLDAPPITSVTIASSTSLAVNFTPVTNGSTYTAQASTDNFATIDSTVTATSPATIVGLTSGASYKVRIKATGAGYADSGWTTSPDNYIPA